MLLGPAVAGLTMIAITEGMPGLQDLWRRQLRWRVHWRWYAIAVLTTPILLLAVLGPLSIMSPAFVPSILATNDLLEVLAFALVSGLFAGFLEEVGWTGFALPRLRRQHNLLVAGLVLGMLWGVWHGLADYWGSHIEFGNLWLTRIALWTAALTAYRMLISWVYENTASLLLAELMHASFTGSQGLLVPALSPEDHFIWYSLFTVLLWMAALVVVTTTRHYRTS